MNLIDTKIDKIFEGEILPKLIAIEGVSVLEGYMTLYATDLLSGEDDTPSFPCISVELGDDSVEPQGNETTGVITRTLLVKGAVTTAERELVNKMLNNIVYHVRKALCIDRFNAKQKRMTLSKSIRLGKTTYHLPANTDQYAYFEMDITIEYSEDWK